MSNSIVFLGYKKSWFLQRWEIVAFFTKKSYICSMSQNNLLPFINSILVTAKNADHAHALLDTEIRKAGGVKDWCGVWAAWEFQAKAEAIENGLKALFVKYDEQKTFENLQKAIS